MTLIKYNDNSYVNADLIERIFVFRGNYYAICKSGSEIELSEEAFKTILIYGKAKI